MGALAIGISIGSGSRLSHQSQTIAVERLFTDLLVHFPIFITSGYATAEWGHVKHNGSWTVHFHGYAKVLGIDLGHPH
jgi:hypothetical protein